MKVDGWKALPDDVDGVHSGTPPLKGHRMVVSSAATARKGQPRGQKLIGRYGVRVAFFHAFNTGKIAVIPPEDVYDGHVWYLLKAMNGTREASKQWGEFVENKVTKEAFKYVDILVSELGLANAEGVDTPSSKDTGKGDRSVNKRVISRRSN